MTATTQFAHCHHSTSVFAVVTNLESNRSVTGSTCLLRPDGIHNHHENSDDVMFPTGSRWRSSESFWLKLFTWRKGVLVCQQCFP